MLLKADTNANGIWTPTTSSDFCQRQGVHGWFKTHYDRCSAAWHPGAVSYGHGAIRAVAVLCPSLGIEYIRGRRGFRHLAFQLSQHGIATLRFDLPDTGDCVALRDGDAISAGPANPPLVDRWEDALDCAVSLVSLMQPSLPVILVGRRFGGVLAARTARRHSAVTHLVLWDTCITGANFLREMRMLEAAGTDRRPGSPAGAMSDGGDVESFGFRIAADAAMRIESMALLPDFTPGTRSSRLHIAAVHPSPSPRLDKVLAAWAPHTGHITQTVCEDAKYDPECWRTPDLPWQTYEAILAALESIPSGNLTAERISAVDRHAHQPIGEHTHEVCDAVSTAGGVRERVVRLGGENRLLGRLSERLGPTPATLGVVVLRALGGSGANVKVARQWAAQGATVLRVDLSGNDESAARPGEPENVPYPAHGVDDVREIVDWLRVHLGDNAIIAVTGECADAYFAVHAAANGVAIDDVIAVNPPLYWNGTFDLDFSEIAHVNAYTPHFQKRSRRARILALLKQRDWPQRLLRASRVRVARIRSTFINVLPVAEIATPAFSKLIHLDFETLFPPTCRWHLVYSQGDPGLQHLHAHGRPAMDRLTTQSGFALTIAPTEEHVFLRSADRQWLNDFMTSRLQFGNTVQSR